MIEADVRTLLLTDSGISDAVGGERISPGVGTQGDPRPLITYEATGDDSEMLFDGPSEFSTGTIEYTIEAVTYVQLRQIREAMKTLLNGFAGVLGTVEIAQAKLADDGDIDELVEEGSDTPFFCCVDSYTFLYRAVGS